MEKARSGLLYSIIRKLPEVRRLYKAHKKLVNENKRLGAQLAAECGSSPFFHYNATFEPQEVMRRHAVPDLKKRAGYLTNFLGVVIDPKFFPTILQNKAGQVEGIPIPANWHADIAEWGAALRAVDLARSTFTVIELGCGWGCWMNNTGLAARRAGLDVHLIGVEGDEGHATFARESCAANGFSPDQVSIYRGIAGPTSGIALFPRQDQPGVGWGLEAIYDATEEQRKSASESGAYDELPIVTLEELAAPHGHIDLLHIDIQGAEADLIAGCLPILRERFVYLVVGTHSRQIEGRIMETLLQDGWILEIERPAILTLDAAGPRVTVDGVQGWRNPRLCPI